MDSSKHGMSKSEFEGDQSVVTGTQGGNQSGIQAAYDYKVSIAKIKNVFKLLISECPFLIDDKAYAESEGKPVKEQFTIQIDSIRKSLGIDNMDDVELLVLTFYEFAERIRFEQMNSGAASAGGPLANGSQHHEGEQHSDDHASNQGGKKAKASSNAVHEEKKSQINQDDPSMPLPLSDEDPLVIDNDDIVGVLKDFHRKREEKSNNAELLGNPRMKKRSNFETEEQKKERIKREERIFWEKMTTVLDDRKLSTWKALDKALSKYYSLLVERQNLIEETGLLNQQNEELKTLLN
jgi:dynein regulatry complex protein 1